MNQTVGAYASANAATDIAVIASLTPSNYIANSGTLLSNYILPKSATGNIGTITAAPLTITYIANPEIEAPRIEQLAIGTDRQHRMKRIQ